MKRFLETERLILRQFTTEDIENLVQLDSDESVMRFINGGVATERNAIASQFLPKVLNYYQRYQNYGFWAVVEKSSQDFLGWFHLIPGTEHPLMVELNLVNSDEIALGYRLRRSSWGKGYATEGSQSLVNQAFQKWKIEKIVAWALAVNQPSIRVMQKIGLQLELEFAFRKTQLPLFSETELQAVKYALTRQEYEAKNSKN